MKHPVEISVQIDSERMRGEAHAVIERWRLGEGALVQSRPLTDQERHSLFHAIKGLLDDTCKRWEDVISDEMAETLRLIQVLGVEDEIKAGKASQDAMVDRVEALWRLVATVASIVERDLAYWDGCVDKKQIGASEIAALRAHIAHLVAPKATDAPKSYTHNPPQNPETEAAC